MTPELKLAFQQKIYELHINSSIGVDEKNIAKLIKIVVDLYAICDELYCSVYSKEKYVDLGVGEKPGVVIVGKTIMLENDVDEATKELNTKVKPHRPEAK